MGALAFPEPGLSAPKAGNAPLAKAANPMEALVRNVRLLISLYPLNEYVFCSFIPKHP
jgi:hypothetical protein